MINIYLNGNISSFGELYRELNKDARRDFIDYIFSEVNPQELIGIIKETI
jgi:hypothetical protein